MGVFEDSLGNRYTAASGADLEKLEAAIEAWLGVRADGMDVLKLALAADVPMALCLQAHIVKSAANPYFDPVVERALAALKDRVSSLSEQEQRHVAALELVVDDDSSRAIEELEALLAEYPRDMIALRVAHMAHFYAGRAGDMRDSTDRAMRHWGRDDAFYGYLLGMHAFGCEEAGSLDQARDLALGALDVNSCDVWAAHANAHGYQSRDCLL